MPSNNCLFLMERLRCPSLGQIATGGDLKSIITDARAQGGAGIFGFICRSGSAAPLPPRDVHAIAIVLHARRR